MWCDTSARANSRKLEASRMSRKDAALLASSTTESMTPYFAGAVRTKVPVSQGGTVPRTAGRPSWFP